MAYEMPQDFNGRTIPVLSLKNGGAHAISLTTATARNTTAMAPSVDNARKGNIVVALFSDVDCFINMGDNTVEAALTDHFIPAGIYINLSLLDTQTHIAAIVASGTGTLHISELR